MMRLNDREMTDLAAFFAKRFEVDLSPASDEAGRAVREAAWYKKLRSAQRLGGLGALAKKIARLDPLDENLQEASKLLGVGGGRLPLVLGAVGLIAVIGLVMFWPSAEPEQEILPAPEVVAEAPKPEVPTPAVVEAAVAEKAEVVESVDPQIEAPAPAPTPQKRSAAVAPKQPQKNTDAAHDTTQWKYCAQTKDLVGYWYAGDTSPGSVGATITVENWVNVRADYPGHHNEYNARTKVACVIRIGQTVKLSTEPLLVPGDKYWVRVQSGDFGSN